MKVFLLLCLCGASLAATVIDPDTCTTFPCLIFEDEFDTFDHDVWEHEITLGGGGNGEFQAYVNNRSISYVRDSTLFIKPALTSEWQTEEFLTSGTLNIWGSHGRNEACSGPFFSGCERAGTATNLINPIMSARLRSLHRFSFRYGRLEIRAKTPRGDWLWPAMWMMPENFPYGAWPASGEIDVMESRGNDNFGTIGNTVCGSTLHWGPYSALNSFPKTTSEYNNADGSAFPDNFHIWRFDWSDTSMNFYLDDVLQATFDPITTFWDFGEFDLVGDLDNIWASGGKMTPFDQNFNIILNVAVGGTGGYFPDGVGNKPWTNVESTAPLSFWNARGDWLPTWQQGEGKISEGAALQVDYIRAYKLVNTEM